MASSKKTFLLKINVFKTKRAYNKPPETAVFCYTENNNKKALTSIIQDKKTIIKLSKQTLLFTFLAATSKKKKRIKSGIQKTLILVFILKHCEKQTKKPANTNIKRQQTATKTTMFYVKRPFLPRKKALFNSNDQGLCRISGMSFGCFSHNLRKSKRRKTCKHTFCRVKMTYCTTYIS